MNFVVCRAAVAVIVAVFAAPSVSAQQYPSKPVRIIVPFGTGSPDTVARVLGQQLGQQMGQPFLVENRIGANGVIGSEAVAKAAPDGYTLLLTPAAITTAPAMRKSMPFDLVRDLAPITNVCTAGGLIVVVNAGSGAKTLLELAAKMRGAGAGVTLASPGVGNTLHLAGELLNARVGGNMVHVPYKGAGPAAAAVLANEVDMMVSSPPPVLPLIRAGKLRALAYTDKARAPFLPDVPTLAEAGVPNLVIDGGWFGLLAPARTPPEIIAKLNEEVRKALATAFVRERFAPLGLDPLGDSPAEFRAHIEAQIKHYAEVIKLAKIQPE
jgi:tripartite-type tricarboxylate transporter receptor subunit TctC